MHQPIASLNLAHQINEITREIKRLGLVYVKDVNDENVTSSEEWKECTKVPTTQTAFNLYREERNQLKISTTINDLDDALNGGLKCAQICELCGKTGSGKTQLCFMISVNYLLCNERDLGGVFFISTNDNFAQHRIKELIKYSSEYKNKSDLEREPFLNGLMERIHVIDVCDITELVATVKYLEKWLLYNKLSIFIIDSMFIPFKMVEFEKRTQILYSLLADLQRLAALNEFTILLTNNYTTRPANDSNPCNQPMCLGENYYHRINLRILLSKLVSNLYSATVLKSNLCKQVNVKFTIK